MVLSYLKNIISRFGHDTRGTIAVEAVVTLPLLFWALAATYEFFEVHRYKSIREKATYTIADIISRETTPGFINAVYMDNTKVLFDEMTNNDGTNQVRVTIVKFSGDTNTYSVSWSKVRGDGDLVELTNADVSLAHSELPMMNDGTELILVDTHSTYTPLFRVGLRNNIDVDSRTFTSIRFLPQIVWQAG